MRRLMLAVLALALATTACKTNQDSIDLRNRIGASSNLARAYTVRVDSADAAFVIGAKLEDDLRYALSLQSPSGKPLLDYVVRDDALAVRVSDQNFAGKLATSLGDPVVDKALKSGSWVVDPAGAPPSVQATSAQTVETSGNPLQDARSSFRFIQTAADQASAVKKFSLEDIEYRSAYDPWRYPTDAQTEVRYDMTRPGLPKSEAATNRGATGDIGPASFRKLSVFVKQGRVEQICEYVDVNGHEDFVNLRRRGLKSNLFLARLLQRIQAGDTSVPIKQRYVVTTVDYPPNTTVEIPKGAVPGKLATFNSALQQAVAAGVLRPSGPVNTSDCVRNGVPYPTISS